MSHSIINVAHLGKRYRIKHQAERQRYTALRDVITNRLAHLIRSWKSLPNTHALIEDFWALKDISFEVNQGEVVGIIGRNGAGKSTLLKVLSRITEPTEGRVRIKGRVASLLEVGTGFHPELTGRENIFLNGAILGMSRAEIRTKFDEIVSFAEVDKFLDTPVKRYSSGMYVRLAFAVAAHLEPEILIVDEVLAVGDSQFQKKCLGKMQEVSAGGRTVLFVSHNMVAVRTLCSRGIFLQNGQTIADDEVNSVVDKYLRNTSTLNGNIEWHDPTRAPGDETVRLKAVTVASEGAEPGAVDIQRDFTISVDYWVLKNDSRLLISFHLYNSRGELVLTTANMTSMTSTYDCWVEQPYSIGVFRTSCIFPGRILNDGHYSISLYINDSSTIRHHVYKHDVLAFEIIDTGYMREEYQGPWLGSLRMKLPWSTCQLANACTKADDAHVDA